MKKNIAPQIFDIDTKNDGLDWKCMFCQDMAILATMFPGGISLLWDSQFCTRESWEMQKQPLSYWEFAGETPMLNIWMFQGKSFPYFPYRTSIHLCAIKKTISKFLICLGHFEVLDSTVQPKKKSFFQGKNPSPSCTRTRRLENLDTWKSLQVTVVSDGFFPHWQTNKNICAAVKVGKHVYFKDWDWTSEKKIVETTNYIWNPFKKTHWATSHQLLSFFLLYLLFRIDFFGKKNSETLYQPTHFVKQMHRCFRNSGQLGILKLWACLTNLKLRGKRWFSVQENLARVFWEIYGLINLFFLVPAPEKSVGLCGSNSPQNHGGIQENHN